MRYIILKEFKKFKFAFYAFLLCAIFAMIWCVNEISRGSARFGEMMYWLQVVYNKAFTLNHLDEINLIFCGAIGLLSMLYERRFARIRVQFHYPHSYFKNILTIVGVPLAFIIFVFALEFIAAMAIFRINFANEIAWAILSTIIYSFAFGVGIFFLIQSMVLGPNLVKIAANSLFLLGSLEIYFKINPDIGYTSYFYLNDKFYIFTAIFIAYSVSSLVLCLRSYKQGYIK